jgi:hypothetical protein
VITLDGLVWCLLVMAALLAAWGVIWSRSAHDGSAEVCVATQNDHGREQAVSSPQTIAPLRILIHRHLVDHPGLTAYEISRVLGRSMGAVFDALVRMEWDGVAERSTAARHSGDRRPSIRWRAL